MAGAHPAMQLSGPHQNFNAIGFRAGCGTAIAMSGETVLIAAFSGRALAQSARRAGFVPLVVDAFGDADTRAAAAHYVQLPDAVRRGFSAKPLFAAIETLIAKAATPPIGIVLGSGFEDRPKLIESLDDRYRLLGTKAETVAELKKPGTFFPLLKQLGIAHPPTTLSAPDDREGWLAKRVGAAGGAHIREFANLRRPHAGHYFQRRLSGEARSVMAISAQGGLAMEFSRQWVCPSARKPFRYGGAVITEYAETSPEQQMVSAAATLVELLDPVGLISFDFIVNDATAYLLEVNPRPGATLDVFDDLNGNLFRAQVEAGLGNGLWQDRMLPNVQSRASALLYADRGPLIAGKLEWPDWVSDRPLPGTTIASEQPLATVHADGASAEDAETNVRARLSRLADLVYTQFQNKT
ncbi:MAG: ATP-grasp domain-containing protein [Hyphomicrobium sp.]